MDGGVLLVIGMASATVVSALMEQILSSTGKMGAAQILDMTTKGGLVVTGLTVFAKVVKVAKTLA